MKNESANRIFGVFALLSATMILVLAYQTYVMRVQIKMMQYDQEKAEASIQASDVLQAKVQESTPDQANLVPVFPAPDPLQVVVYSDSRARTCPDAQRAIQRLQTDFKNQIKVDFKYFPEAKFTHSASGRIVESKIARIMATQSGVSLNDSGQVGHLPRQRYQSYVNQGVEISQKSIPVVSVSGAPVAKPTYENMKAAVKLALEARAHERFLAETDLPMPETFNQNLIADCGFWNGLH